MRFYRDAGAQFVIVSLEYRDLLLESLSRVAREAEIATGVVTSGIGSLTRARIHTVSSNDYPPKNTFIDLDGPLEVVQFGGIIADYQPHIHISLWDREQRFYGGHLEEGCEILALAEISIKILPDLRLTRRPNSVGTSLLDEA